MCELPLALIVRMKKRTLVHATHLWAAKGLNAAVADPWTPILAKHSWWDYLQYNTDKECPLTSWKLCEPEEPSSNKVQLEWEVWIDLWHVPPEIWIELGEQIWEEEIHSLPDMPRMANRIQTQGSKR